MQTDLKAGDKVMWTSSNKVKTGTLLAIVPANTSANQYVPSKTPKSRRQYDCDCSLIDRALISSQGGANGTITYYYAPRLSLVCKIHEQPLVPVSKEDAQQAVDFLSDKRTADAKEQKAFNTAMTALQYILSVHNGKQAPAPTATMYREAIEEIINLASAAALPMAQLLERICNIAGNALEAGKQ